MAQEDTHAQKMAACEQHKQAHIKYWQEHGNRPTDPKRFEDGFISGWCDAENPSYPNIGRDSMIGQRQGENVQACGNSDCEWAFGDGYHEGFDSRRCLNTSQQPAAAPPKATPADCGNQCDTHAQKMAACEQHKQGHINYWRANGNRKTDAGRFEAGFISGWCDCENPDLPDCTRDSMLGQRQDENVKQCGQSDCEWAFGDGYHEGFDSRCKLNQPQPDTHPEKVKECEQHKQAHTAYWKEHGNRPTDVGRFEAGFVDGWCDAENTRWPCINRDKLLCHRQDQNVQQCGNSSCEWAFTDGYHEGFDARRCLKPQGAAPAPPAPAPVPVPEHPTAPPPTQVPSTSTNCPPATAPPTTAPVAPAPVPVPQPPPVVNPSSPPAANPTAPSAPKPSDHPTSPPSVPTKPHQCSDQCAHPPNDWCSADCSHGSHSCGDSCAHPTTKHCHGGCQHPKSHRCNDQCSHEMDYNCTLECKHGSHQCSERCNHARTTHCRQGCRHDGWNLMRRTQRVKETETVYIVEIDITEIDITTIDITTITFIEIDIIEVDYYVEVDEGHECTDDCRGKHKKHEGLLHRMAHALKLDD